VLSRKDEYHEMHADHLCIGHQHVGAASAFECMSEVRDARDGAEQDERPIPSRRGGGGEHEEFGGTARALPHGGIIDDREECIEEKAVHKMESAEMNGEESEQEDDGLRVGEKTAEDDIGPGLAAVFPR
jgi:hypothetical protein